MMFSPPVKILYHIAILLTIPLILSFAELSFKSDALSKVFTDEYRAYLSANNKEQVIVFEDDIDEQTVAQNIFEDITNSPEYKVIYSNHLERARNLQKKWFRLVVFCLISWSVIFIYFRKIVFLDLLMNIAPLAIGFFLGYI